jgi:hypothetical protein
MECINLNLCLTLTSQIQVEETPFPVQVVLEIQAAVETQQEVLQAAHQIQQVVETQAALLQVVLLSQIQAVLHQGNQRVEILQIRLVALVLQLLPLALPIPLAGPALLVC